MRTVARFVKQPVVPSYGVIGSLGLQERSLSEAFHARYDIGSELTNPELRDAGLEVAEEVNYEIEAIEALEPADWRKLLNKGALGLPDGIGFYIDYQYRGRTNLVITRLEKLSRVDPRDLAAKRFGNAIESEALLLASCAPEIAALPAEEREELQTEIAACLAHNPEDGLVFAEWVKHHGKLSFAQIVELVGSTKTNGNGHSNGGQFGSGPKPHAKK